MRARELKKEVGFDLRRSILECPLKAPPRLKTHALCDLPTANVAAANARWRSHRMFVPALNCAPLLVGPLELRRRAARRPRGQYTARPAFGTISY